jgi:VIT1/CCC1 family predicted Fe2+/Mn2+ transporter
MMNGMELEQSNPPVFPSEPGHIYRGRSARDVVLGMNDGMVTLVSFLGGLTGSAFSHSSILYAGVMTAIAGSLSMAFGGYLAARSQMDIYKREIAREKWEIDHVPELERAEVYNLFLNFGLDARESSHITEQITANPKAWHRFMVREELGIHEERIERPLTGSLVLGVSFLVGTIPPLLPYFFIQKIGEAFTWSLFFSCLALTVAGGIKSRLSNEMPLKGAGEMLLLGGMAGAAGLFLGTLLPKFFSLLPPH